MLSLQSQVESVSMLPAVTATMCLLAAALITLMVGI
jgi:hypothetical protein